MFSRLRAMDVMLPDTDRVTEAVLLATTALFLVVLPMPHTVTIRLGTLFLAVALSVVAVTRHGMPRLPLVAAFVAWAGVALLSLVYAADPLYSLGEIKAEIVYGFAVYFVFYTQARGERHWWVWLSALLLSLLLLSFFNLDLWLRTGGAESPWYFYNGVGAYTSYWITVFPLVFLFFFRLPVSGALRTALRLVPFLFLMPVFLTRNRAVWFAFIVSCAVLFALILYKTQPPKRKRRLVFSLIVVAGAILLFYGSLQYKMSVQWGSINIETLIGQTIDRDPRPELWQFLVNDIAHHPWRGAGFGILSFDYAYPQVPAKDPALFHAHNVFINAAVQMGIPGMIVMALVFFAILREYWRLYRTDNGLVQWIGAAGIAIVIGVLLRNMTDDFFRRDLALLFWSVVGMTLGYGKYIAAKSAERNPHETN